MSLQNFEKLKKLSSKIKKVFFFRVCGTGMGAAACLLKEKGFQVEGGDINFYPPMSTYLEKSDIKLHQLENITSDYLKTFDLIIVGNVVPKGSEAASMIENLGVDYASFPCALGALVLSDINVIGVAGTHGKTTTTYFLTQIFKSLGEKPGHFIGGVIEGMSSSVLGEGKYFFIESDEYDSAYFEKISKFRQYTLNHMILTSLEFDHADIFDSIEDIKEEFRVVLKNFNGLFIADGSYNYTQELLDEKICTHIDPLYYGLNKSPNILQEAEEGTEFEVILGEKTCIFKTNIIGLHNILNITSAIIFAYSSGFKVADIQNAVSELYLVKRRQELRGKYGQAIVIDDFAHHPRAVEMTINAVKSRFPKKNICVVMEPNSATARSSLFQKEFEESLNNADHFIFAKPARKSSIKGTSNLDGEKIVEYLSKRNIKGLVVEEWEILKKELDNFRSDNDVILILSNGTCLGLWESDFVDELQSL